VTAWRRSAGAIRSPIFTVSHFGEFVARPGEGELRHIGHARLARARGKSWCRACTIRPGYGRTPLLVRATKSLSGTARTPIRCTHSSTSTRSLSRIRKAMAQWLY
jgi:hypothetical protein